MTVLGAQSGYAIVFDENGLLEGVFICGVRIDIKEDSSEVFACLTPHLEFSWGAKISEIMPCGPVYAIHASSECCQRQVRMYATEYGNVIIDFDIRSCTSSVFFKYNVSGPDESAHAWVKDQQGRIWNVKIESSQEFNLYHKISFSAPTLYRLSLTLRLELLSVIITDDVEEAAILSSVLGQGSSPVIVLPPEKYSIDYTEFSNSPLFRTIMSLTNYQVVCPSRLIEIVRQLVGSEIVTSEDVLQSAKDMPVLRTPSSSLPYAVVLSRRQGCRIVVDEDAQNLPPLVQERMIFFDVEGLSTIAAANYAVDVSAGIKRLPKVTNSWLKDCSSLINSIHKTLQSGRGASKTVDKSIAYLSKKVASHYNHIVGQAKEACAFMDNLSIPLSLGSSIAIAQVPSEIAYFFVAKEIVNSREAGIGPTLSTICTSGVEEKEAEYAFANTWPQIKKSGWYVNLFGADDIQANFLLRFHTADFFYFITHGDVGIMQSNSIESMWAKELAEIRLVNQPFIFNNSCTSWPLLGAAALRAGASAYLGTLWPVSLREAANFGTALVRGLSQGLSWANAVSVARHEIPERERLAYFYVGSSFRVFQPVQDISEEESVALVLHAIGRHLYEQTGILATCKRTGSDVSLLMTPMLFSRSNYVLPDGWEWLIQTRLISAMNVIPNHLRSKKFENIFQDTLSHLTDAYYDEQLWSKCQNTALRPSLGDALFDLHLLFCTTLSEQEDWQYLEKIERILMNSCKDWGHEEYIPIAENNLAKALLHTGRLDEAETILDASIRKRVKSGSLHTLFETFLTQSTILQHKGEHKKAIKLLTQLIEEWSLPNREIAHGEFSTQKKLCIVLANRANSYLATDQVSDAIRDLETALFGFIQINLKIDIIKTHLQLAAAYQRVHVYERVRSNLTLAIELSNKEQIPENCEQPIKLIQEWLSVEENKKDKKSGVSTRKTDEIINHIQYSGEFPPELIAWDKYLTPEVTKSIIEEVQELSTNSRMEDLEATQIPHIAYKCMAVRAFDEAMKWFNLWEKRGFPVKELTEDDLKNYLVAYENLVRILKSASEVEETFKRLLDHFPAISALWAEYGTWLCLENRHHEAKKHLERSLELDDSDTQAMYYLSEIEYKQGNIEQAINILGPALQLQPDGQSFNRMGHLLEKANLTEAAIDHYRQASVLGSTDAIFNLAILSSEQGHTNAAQQYFLQYLEHCPEDWEAWSRMSNVLWLDGNFEWALDCAENALMLDPVNSACIRVWLAAISAIGNKYLQVSPRFEHMRLNTFNITDFYQIVNKLDTATPSELIDLAEKSKTNFILRMLVGIFHAQDDDLESALRVLESLTEDYPYDHLSQLLIYSLSKLKGEEQKGRDALSKAELLLKDVGRKVRIPSRIQKGAY